MAEQTPSDTPEIRAFKQDLEAMYNKGIPFYTKDYLKDILNQVKAHKVGRKDDKIYLTNLKGEQVETIMDPNQTTIWKDDRCYHGEHLDRDSSPYLYYRSIQMMLDPQDMEPFDLQKAYLPIAVLYPAARQDTHFYYAVRPSPHLTVEKLGELLQTKQQEWETSAQHRRLNQVLTNHRHLLASAKKIVAFACGPLAKGRGVWNTSGRQHALLLSLQRMLAALSSSPPSPAENKPETETGTKSSSSSTTTPEKIRCFAQDPAYHAIDAEVLKGRGVECLEDPEAFLELDDETVVLSFAPNVPVRQIVADLARPVVIIQDLPDDDGDEAGLYDVDCYIDSSSPRVDNTMTNEYIALPIPSDEFLDGFMVYIRKSTT
ncbi:hypothetical protein M426DRAFT_260487 [Hypoxylon sp. CI-4A]|nr:hypothetical protein M426DRAFT_260487 [Hypoxylon sp. CI-4A]